MRLVCASCGKNEGFYRNIEVSGIGWSDVEATIEEDGSVSALVDRHVQEIDWDTNFSTPIEFGCAGCGAQREDFDDLVAVEYDEEDRLDERARKILHYERNPIPGQLRLGAA